MKENGIHGTFNSINQLSYFAESRPAVNVVVCEISISNCWNFQAKKKKKYKNYQYGTTASAQQNHNM